MNPFDWKWIFIPLAAVAVILGLVWLKLNYFA